MTRRWCWRTPSNAPARPTSRKLRDAIAATKDFAGVTGKTTLDANRNATKPRGHHHDQGRQVQICRNDQSLNPQQPLSAARDAAGSVAVRMTEFLQQLINGLSLGAIYALIALGYTMVYGVLRFINFAHSDVFMVGAFAGFYLCRNFSARNPWRRTGGAGAAPC